MDILISSNLERLLYEMSGRDAGRVADWMTSLSEEGRYDVGADMKREIGALFHGGWTPGTDVLRTIEETWRTCGYVADTHTAVGLDVYRRYVEQTADNTLTVVVSTASPFKFSDHVAGALFGKASLQGLDEFDMLDLLSERTGWAVPTGLDHLRTRPVLHQVQCRADGMKDTVEQLLALNRKGQGGCNG